MPVEPDISRDKTGVVTIEAPFENLELYYSLSSKLPVKSWIGYTKPVPMPYGGILNVKMVASPESGLVLPGGKTIIRREYCIKKDKWKIVAFDSEETSREDGRAINAIDGNYQTKWLTQWSDAKTSHPHFITIDLGETIDVAGFNYLPRQDAPSGHVLDYEFYLSTDGNNWGSPVAAASFENAANSVPEHIRLRKSKIGRYVKFVSTKGVSNEPFADVAEIGVFSASQ